MHTYINISIWTSWDRSAQDVATSKWCLNALLSPDLLCKMLTSHLAQCGEFKWCNILLFCLSYPSQLGMSPQVSGPTIQDDIIHTINFIYSLISLSRCSGPKLGRLLAMSHSQRWGMALLGFTLISFKLTIAPLPLYWSSWRGFKPVEQHWNC